jgi:hypothetical protein
MLSPTSVLEIPTARPARRYDSPSSKTAATASRRTSSDSGRVPPRPGGHGGSRWARQAPGQPSTLAGSDERGQYDDTGPDLHGRLEHLAYSLVPVNVRTHRASRTLSMTSQRKPIQGFLLAWEAAPLAGLERLVSVAVKGVDPS